MLLLWMMCALLFETASADLIFEGLSNYKPDCYKGNAAGFYIEYNQASVYTVFGETEFRDDSYCKTSAPPLQFPRSFFNYQEGSCTFVIQVAENMDDKSARNQPLRRQFKGSIKKGVKDSAFIQFIPYSTKEELYKHSEFFGFYSVPVSISVSLMRGIRRIFIPYFDYSPRYGYRRAMQLRLTQDFVDTLKAKLRVGDLPAKSSDDPSKAEEPLGDLPSGYVTYDITNGLQSLLFELTIEMECFMAVGSIPFEQRSANMQVSDCVRLTGNPGVEIKEDLPMEGKDFTDVLSCEQGLHVKEQEKKPAESTMVDQIKSVYFLGLEMIPTYGPILSQGAQYVDALLTDPSKFTDLFKSAAGNITEHEIDRLKSKLKTWAERGFKGVKRMP